MQQYQGAEGPTVHPTAVKASLAPHDDFSLDNIVSLDNMTLCIKLVESVLPWSCSIPFKAVFMCVLLKV